MENGNTVLQERKEQHKQQQLIFSSSLSFFLSNHHFFENVVACFVIVFFSFVSFYYYQPCLRFLCLCFNNCVFVCVFVCVLIIVFFSSSSFFLFVNESTNTLSRVGRTMCHPTAISIDVRTGRTHVVTNRSFPVR